MSVSMANEATPLPASGSNRLIVVEGLPNDGWSRELAHTVERPPLAAIDKYAAVYPPRDGMLGAICACTVRGARTAQVTEASPRALP